MMEGYTFSIDGFNSSPEDLGHVDHLGQWTPNKTVAFLANQVEQLRAELEAVKKERDAIKGTLGCEDCKFFNARDDNALTDPDVSDAALKAVFHDVKEIRQWKSRKELEEQLAACQKDANIVLDYDLRQYRIWLDNVNVSSPPISFESWRYEKYRTEIDAAMKEQTT